MGEKEQGDPTGSERKSGSIIAADYGGPAGTAVTDEGVGPAKPSKPTK
jgi:hypothetical protein